MDAGDLERALEPAVAGDSEKSAPASSARLRAVSRVRRPLESMNSSSRRSSTTRRGAGLVEGAAERRLERGGGREVQLAGRDHDRRASALLVADGEGLGDRDVAHARGSVSLAYRRWRAPACAPPRSGRGARPRPRRRGISCPLNDRELGRVAARTSSYSRRGQLDQPGAVRRAALADEADQRRVIVRVPTALDVLVDPAEGRLVAGDPLLHVRGHPRHSIGRPAGRRRGPAGRGRRGARRR